MQSIRRARKINSEKTLNTFINKLDECVISETIGKKIEGYNVWIENRNSIIYKIEIDNYIIVGKQSKFRNSKNLEYEYNSLKELAKIQCEKLLVPKVLGLNLEFNIFFMELVDGVTLASAVNNRNLLYRSIGLIANVLNSIHTLWYKKNVRGVVEQIIADIKTISGGINKKEKNVLNDIRALFNKEYLPVGKLYYDLAPINMYLNDHEITLIDPPEEEIIGLLYWDLATFIFGLKQELIKRKLYLTKNDLLFIDDYRQQLIKMYIQKSKIVHMEFDKVYLLVVLLELQRTGQFLAYREKYLLTLNKLSLERTRHLIAFKLLKKQQKSYLTLITKLVSNIHFDL